MRGRRWKSSAVPTTRLLVALALALFGAAGCRSCVALDAPVAFPCRPDSGEEQCPTAWRCGVEGRCHDRSVSAAYPCVRDDDCELGDRCGLEHVCHSRDAGAPLRCETDVDCERGWRCACCGEPKRCHDPQVASDYLCQADSDCELGWQCGLTGRCHSRELGAPYPCKVDTDCTSGWRCGFESVCVDTTTEGLQPAYEGPLQVERISPLAGVEISERAAVSHWPSRAFDLARDSGLVHIAAADGGQLLESSFVALDGGQLLALVALGDRSYFLDAVGFREVSWQTGAVRTVAPASGAQRLKLIDESGQVLGLGTDSLWLYDARSDTMTPTVAVPALDGGALRLFDVAGVRFSDSVGLFAATEDGVFVADASPDGGMGSWAPRAGPALPNVQCGLPQDAGPQYRAERIEAENSDGWSLMMGVRAFDGSGPMLVQGQIYLFDCPSSGNFTSPPWPCPICAPGDSVVDLSTEAHGGWSWVNARCEGPNGAPPYLQGRLTVGGTSEQPNVCPAPYQWRPTDVGRPFSVEQGTMVLATAHGQLMSEGPWETQDTLTLNGEVAALERAEGRLWVGGWFNGWVQQLGLGLVLAEGPRDASTPVEVDPGELSAWAVTRDGGRWRVAGGDPQGALYAGPEDAGLTFRLAPRPFFPITSLAALPPRVWPDGGAPFMSGYALTGSGLFYFEATSESHWLTRELTLPRKKYLSVWTDGAFGRVAATDGIIYSLPSQVALSQPFPDAGVAYAYRRVCGQPYALGASGLFRLQRAVDGGVASWAREDLSHAITGYDVDPGFDRATLQRLGSDLFFTNPYGGVVRLTPPVSCP